MTKGLAGFHLLVKYELGVSILRAILGAAVWFHFAQTGTVAHRGLLNTHPALAIMALVTLPIYNLVCSCG